MIDMSIKSYSYSKQGNLKVSDHFAVYEFASKNGGKLYSDTVKIDTELLNILEKLYVFLNCSKMIITSGYRTAEHDKAVGGNGKGYHVYGQAADINVYKQNGQRYHGSEICCALQQLEWNRGIGWIAGAAVHVDTRVSKYWFDEQNGNRSIGSDWFAYFKNKGYTVNFQTLGDIDGDGEVTSTDARIALQAATGKIKLDAGKSKAADIDGDGKVTSTDAQKILKKSAKK